jgi:catechol 2,3-dioxygenase-like lactoylglutathione lyase family enzyme
MVSGLDTIMIMTRDMAAARGFYETVLGRSPGYASAHWTSFPLGDVQLGLHLSDGGPPSDSGVVACFRCDSLDDLEARLRQTEARVAPERHETPRGELLDFWDCDGHHLQAIKLK